MPINEKISFDEWLGMVLVGGILLFFSTMFCFVTAEIFLMLKGILK